MASRHTIPFAKDKKRSWIVAMSSTHHIMRWIIQVELFHYCRRTSTSVVTQLCCWQKIKQNCSFVKITLAFSCLHSQIKLHYETLNGLAAHSNAMCQGSLYRVTWQINSLASNVQMQRQKRGVVAKPFTNHVKRWIIKVWMIHVLWQQEKN